MEGLAGNKDVKFLVGVLIIMIAINVAVTNLQDYFTKNFVLGYTIFTLLYSVFVLWFIFGQTFNNTEISKYIKTLFAWVLVFLALDIIIYPMLVTPVGIPEGLPVNALISSDVFIYSLLPPALPAIARYYITYVGAPVLFLFVAYKLLAKDEKKFTTFVKHNM
jgi:hypothetical protein